MLALLAMIPEQKFNDILNTLIPVAYRAGDAIMAVYGRDDVGLRHKGDASPVTEADEAAEVIILKALKANHPGTLIIAEELASKEGLPPGSAEEFFLVDPLDGTKEFLNKRDAFTVNIALIQRAQPVLGVVYAPARDVMYYGAASSAFKIEGRGKDPVAISTRTADPDHLSIVASFSHRDAATEAYLAHYPGAEHVSVGSSLKFCLVAEGKADLYPRLGPTMEWDTGAGHAVLKAAGGTVVDEAGKQLMYGKPGFKNGRFIARGDETLDFVKFI